MSMQLSTKGRYGFRVLLDIALHQGQGAVPLSEISQREGLSQNYLWQIVSPLKKAGIVLATRGVQGGYLLAREPASITILDIVTALEGSVSLADCVQNTDSCSRSLDCLAREVWSEIEAVVVASMSAMNLEMVLKRHQDRASRRAANYVI